MKILKKKMKTFALGDVHGMFEALKDVLNKSGFKKEQDRLIFLGDAFDSHSKFNGQYAKCVDFLMEISNLVWILGNHDKYVFEWMKNTIKISQEVHWLSEMGGRSTRGDYLLDEHDETGERNEPLIQKHLSALKKAVLWFVDENNNFYVHGGIDWRFPLTDQMNDDVYYWDRDTYFYFAPRYKKKKQKFPYRHVFIGHTSTFSTAGGKTLEPVRITNLYNLDQGIGHGGRLTIMDVDSFEYWQSDKQNEKIDRKKQNINISV